MIVRVALVGNPNVGKSVIFNNLTGAHQYVGNWPGVTVEKKEGKCNFDDVEIHITDLPGIYSLTANSIDELIARNFIIEEKPDVVIDIVDGSNIERNLYLTLQLIELGANVVVALNMMDLAKEKSYEIDIKRLEELLGVPIVPTVAPKKEGMTELCEKVATVAKRKVSATKIRYNSKLEDAISKVASILSSYPTLQKYNMRWLAIKILEDDGEVIRYVKEISENDPVVWDKIEDIKAELNKEFGDVIVAMADERYNVISQIVSKAVKRITAEEEVSITDMLDEVLTHKYLGIPIFLAIMWTVFQFTFTVAAPFSDAIDMLFAYMADLARSSLQPEWFASLIADGIISGLGFVLIFVPNIFMMFLALSILEDSGYLARVAFIMDRIMYKLGLHGRSFIPMLLGFGCNVPAIMATRTIENENDRLITILVNPLMSCSARLPVYVLFAAVFFTRIAGTVIFSMYILGIALAILMALLFRKTLFPGKPSPFIMEMPPYLIPTARSVLSHMWLRGSKFLKKAGTFIVSGLILIWAMSNVPYGAPVEETLIGRLGHLLAPIFAPLGWDWRIAVALFFGFIAKEIVVGSLGVLYGIENPDPTTLYGPLRAAMTPLSAYALMAFTLIYVPCIATLATIKQETGSIKWTLIALAYELILAYVVALIIISIGSLVGIM